MYETGPIKASFTPSFRGVRPMQLYYSTTSPYVRKVRIVAIEKGLDGAIELVDATPWPTPLLAATRNPLGKVPALVLDDETSLYDSPVICEYLDVLGGGAPLVPRDGSARWSVLRAQALADGILDAAVSIVLERRREPARQSPEVIARSADAIRRAVAVMAAEIDAQPAAPFDLGRISACVAIGYLHFRLPDLDLGLTDPRISNWWSLIKDRPSVDATSPTSTP
jgi:glutathione S-transferase